MDQYSNSEGQFEWNERDERKEKRKHKKHHKSSKEKKSKKNYYSRSRTRSRERDLNPKKQSPERIVKKR